MTNSPVGRENAPDVEPAELLRRFDEALCSQGVEVELCVVGGAVMRLVFDGDPATRRPSAIFVDPERALAAWRSAAAESRVALDRLEASAREVARGQADVADVYDGACLRVFAAPPDYVLAMKCAALSWAPESGTEDDIRYLLRYLGARRIDEAMLIVDRYLNPRQRPADLEIRLERLLA